MNKGKLVTFANLERPQLYKQFQMSKLLEMLSGGLSITNLLNCRVSGIKDLNLLHKRFGL